MPFYVRFPVLSWGTSKTQGTSNSDGDQSVRFPFLCWAYKHNYRHTDPITQHPIVDSHNYLTGTKSEGKAPDPMEVVKAMLKGDMNNPNHSNRSSFKYIPAIVGGFTLPMQTLARGQHLIGITLYVT